MQIRIVISTALLLAGFDISAQFKTVRLAHEVPMSELTVPVTSNGSLSFRSCPECTTINSRLTPATRFVINQEDVSLPEFRARVTAVRNRESHTFTVLQHLESNTVTSVSIRL